jgi:hypothetical protein
MDDTTSRHEGGMDRATAAAWRAFQAELADRLAAMETDEVLVVDVLAGHEPEAGATPYVQFCAWGEGMLRGEVASNHVLTSGCELDEVGERALRELGYDAPTYGPADEPDAGSLNFHVDLPKEQADRLAVMSVRALRDVFAVVHPALLDGDVVADAPAELGASERAQGDEAPATFPHGGHEELTELVDAALTPYFGHPPRHDDDGDIPVDLGDTALFVRVCETVPVIEMFACVATDVQDLERAAFEVNVLNRDVRYVKFRLVGDAILADLQLPAWPFVPEQLRAMLAVMTGAVEQVAGDLQARVGGRPLLGDLEVDLEEHPGQEDDAAGDDDAADGGADQGDVGMGDNDQAVRPLAPAPDRAVELLGELEAESAGSVTPELAASVCGHDTTRILDLIRQEERERIEWRTLRDEIAGADDHVEVGCEHEIAYSDRMISLLRRALRVVVEHRAAQDEAAWTQPAGTEPRGTEAAGSGAARGAQARAEASWADRRRSANDRASRPRRPRPRRVPDPTIEEVDPEIWS